MLELIAVKEKIKDLLSKNGYSLETFNFKKKNGVDTLEIVIDRDQAISMEDIVNVSNIISEFLDLNEFTDNPYNLDVSSLGAEKPIKLENIDKALNKYIYVHLTNPIDGLNSYEGDVSEVNEDTITLKIKNKTRYKEININKNNIDKCHYAIKF